MVELNLDDRIAVVYQYKYPDSRGGGERRLYEVFKRFNGLVDWYVQYGGGDVYDKGIRYFSLLNRKFKYRSLRETLSWSIMVLRIPFDKYDVVHVGQMPFFHLFFLMVKVKVFKLIKKRCPVVTIDWWEYWGGYWGRFGFPVSLIGRLVEYSVLKYCKNFIVISNKTKEDIENISGGVISLIHNGIDLGLIGKARAKKSATFIYFGRLEKHKRVDRSIEVFGELVKINPDYTFQIIGDGSHKKDLELLVRKLNLFDSVSFSGRIDDDLEMYSLIKGSECMLFFGSQEGGGSIALFEANACGIPVVHAYSKNGIDAKLVTEKNGFFYDNYDKFKIAKELNLYLMDSNRKQRMRETCIDFVKDKDWYAISNEYKCYFKEIIRDKKSA